MYLPPLLLPPALVQGTLKKRSPTVYHVYARVFLSLKLEAKRFSCRHFLRLEDIAASAGHFGATQMSGMPPPPLTLTLGHTLGTMSFLAIIHLLVQSIYSILGQVISSWTQRVAKRLLRDSWSQINTPSSHVLGGPQLWGRARKCWLRWVSENNVGYNAGWCDTWYKQNASFSLYRHRGSGSIPFQAPNLCVN